jgi:hypothetical protein
MDANSDLLQAIDHLMVASRIRDLSHYALGDRAVRTQRLGAVLSRLPEGCYLIGVGPHCSEIIKVGSDPITIGRAASLNEEPSDTVIDYTVNDASLLGPREVSRLHASVRLSPGGGGMEIRDESSTTGTWLMQQSEQLPEGEWVCVGGGEVVSLGSSGVNVFFALEVHRPG